jgi:hypothetical protein
METIKTTTLQGLVDLRRSYGDTPESNAIFDNALAKEIKKELDLDVVELIRKTFDTD